ncbi:MAG: penicillin-binding protein 2 [Candidatus Omnitrophica bacterium]|nr:penicillin-binding protein 2 [Candidatus Omnitrophota bacterium]
MRIKRLLLSITILFFLVAGGLFFTQVLKSAYYKELSETNRIRLLPIPSPRGRILDRNGIPIVDNRLSYDVCLIDEGLKNREETLKKLAEILKRSPEELLEAATRRSSAPFMLKVICRDIGKEAVLKVEESRLHMPGIIIQTRPLRHYVYGDITSQVSGYVGEIDKLSLSRLKPYGYRIQERIGRAGLEKGYDNYLRGDWGGMQLEVDHMGRQKQVLGERLPQSGRDLKLTLDIELQKIAHEALDGRPGAVIVMDPRDGQILALAGEPAFDPNVFVVPDNTKGVREILKDKSSPLLNRAIGCAYPPGSVFKIAIALSALDSKKISAETSFECSGSYLLGGRRFHCWREGGHGAQRVVDGIKNSCNVFFYNVGKETGVDIISEYGQRFGFGKPTGVDLPDEAAGLLPSRFWKRIVKHQAWYQGETLNFAIGQGFLLVTPIQVLSMVATVANGGEVSRPFVVDRIDDITVGSPNHKRIEISKRHIDVVKEGMRQVVEGDGGTGKYARVKGLSIAGKTGTAQTHTQKTHAWFAGFSPADKPKIALVVFLEYGGKGGSHAAKTAKIIFEGAHNLGYL